MHHQCIINASSTHQQCIIRASFVYHLCNAQCTVCSAQCAVHSVHSVHSAQCASSVPHQRIKSASLEQPQCILSASSVHHKYCKKTHANHRKLKVSKHPTSACLSPLSSYLLFVLKTSSYDLSIHNKLNFCGSCLLQSSHHFSSFCNNLSATHPFSTSFSQTMILKYPFVVYFYLACMKNK